MAFKANGAKEAPLRRVAVQALLDVGTVAAIDDVARNMEIGRADGAKVTRADVVREALRHYLADSEGDENVIVI